MPVVIIEVQHGSYLGEDDIVRKQDDYGRIEPTPPRFAERSGGAESREPGKQRIGK
jgi:hypothetical protein